MVPGMCYHPSWASHLPVLLSLLQRSEGPVVELGIGVFSTPLIHTWCAHTGRPVASYDASVPFHDLHRAFTSEQHTITLVTDWATVPLEQPWGLAFLDHDSERRVPDAIRLAPHAAYVVLHDSENDYAAVYPHYRYRRDYTTLTPPTVVLSNQHDLAALTV